MKQFMIAFVALFVFTAANAQKKPADLVKFTSETVDLGSPKVGNPVTATFTFTNNSKEDMIIETVTPGCGCTKSDYTKEPIKPGKTGTITATYNAAAVGTFSKKVYVKFMGVDQQQELTIIGNVVQ
jgi:membrane carboxypeptidase/penicillin-binding protein